MRSFFSWRRVAAGALFTLLATQACAENITRTRLITTSPSRAGQSVVITAEVDAFGNGGAPRGSVTFFDGATALGSSPLNVLGASQATLAGGPIHNCALTAGGGVKCWGWNGHGQLGDGTTIDRATPVQVAGLTSGVVSVVAGASHTCALTTAGAVKCWGDSMGNGTGAERTTPVTVPGFSSGAVAIAAGFLHTCALTSAGGVVCWGHNVNGQVGNGESAMYTPPTPLGGPRIVYTAVVAYDWHSCGLTSAGAVKCWGRDFGLLPVPTPGAESGVAALTAGYYHNCALTVAGGVKCWGHNEYGQLGDGAEIQRAAAVDVVGLSSGVVAVAAGGDHSCALLGSGGVRCWGRNYKGELGDGTTTDRLTPTPVTSLGGFAVAIATGQDHSCALLSPSRTLRCWGDNELGQIGDGTTTGRALPVSVTSYSGLLRARTRRYAPLGVGVHQLRAVYSGDADHAASTSATVPHQVQ